MDALPALAHLRAQLAAAKTTLTCDQAVFTSVRTPMGEGYRIISASSGLTAEEKQAITRNAPSHDALCLRDKDAAGVAFYPLPSGRVCVAYSCCAGSEHTGRGGMRIYTRSVVFSAAALADVGFNPFNVWRAMGTAGLTVPQLKLPPALPAAKLEVVALPQFAPSGDWAELCPPSLRNRVLDGLLGDRNLILTSPADFITTAELLLLGIPGPLRSNLSLSAGIRYSVGRTYRLSVITDDQGKTAARAAGQPVEFLDPARTAGPAAANSNWSALVGRLWDGQEVAELAARTSLPFVDVSTEGIERTARLYLAIDELAAANLPKLMALAREHVAARVAGPDAALRDALLSDCHQRLISGVTSLHVDDMAAHWSAVVDLWKRSNEAADFMQPVVDALLRSVCHQHPPVAAEMALAVARNIPQAAKDQGHAATLDQILEDFATYCESLDEAERSGHTDLARRWQTTRPQGAAIDQLVQLCCLSTADADH